MLKAWFLWFAVGVFVFWASRRFQLVMFRRKFRVLAAQIVWFAMAMTRVSTAKDRLLFARDGPLASPPLPLS